MLSLLYSIACWLNRLGVTSICECCFPVSRFGCTEREPVSCYCKAWPGVSWMDEGSCEGVAWAVAEGNLGDRKISAKLLGS